MTPLVYAIIPNYNNYEDLLMVVECFQAQLYPNLKVVVVDDGSEEEIFSKFKTIESITLLKNHGNKGWGSANNRGIRYAIENNADYVILANNDIFFDDERLVIKLLNNFKQFGNRSDIAIIGAKNNYFTDKSKTINEGIVVFENKRGYSNFNISRVNKCKESNIPEPFSYVDAVHGCFMVIKTDLFEKIGFFNEKFFMYYDEIEFCYRAWQKGYSCVVNKSLTIYHKVSKSIVQKSPKQIYYLTRNQLIFINQVKKQFLSLYNLKLIWIHFINIANILFRKRKRKYHGRKWSLLSAILKGILHGYFGKTGKRF